MSIVPSREEALYSDALAQPPAERSAFLARACGADFGRLARLLALGAAHDAHRQPAWFRAAHGVGGGEEPGPTVWHYITQPLQSP